MSFRIPANNKAKRSPSGSIVKKDPFTRGKLSGAAQGLLAHLRRWDKASRTERVRILEKFIAKHGHTTGAQLQEEYGNGASLFLARISAWLRLTYLLGFAISQQLRAISIFVGASSGQRFMLEFLETGGVATVLEILTLEKLGEGDKQQCLSLLTHVASSGRNYKELVCEHEGVKIILETLTNSVDEDTQACCKSLILPLGRGNPAYTGIIQEGLLTTLRCYSNPGAQRIAAQALRVLYRDIPLSAQCIEPTLALFKSLDIQVQHEGFELVKLEASDPTISVQVVTRMVELLTPSTHVGVEEMDDVTVMASNTGATQHGHFVTRGKTIPAGFIQQACAARALGVLVTMAYDIAQLAIELDVLTGLFQSMANTSHYESQKAAGATLHTLIRVLPDVEEMASNHMGEDFYQDFLNRPQTIYRDLTVAHLDILRWGAANASTKSAAADAALEQDADEAFDKAEAAATTEDGRTDATDGGGIGEGDVEDALDVNLSGEPDDVLGEGEDGGDTGDNDGDGVGEESRGDDEGADGGTPSPEDPLSGSLYTPFAQAPQTDQVSAFAKAGDHDGDMTEANIDYIRKTLHRQDTNYSDIAPGPDGDLTQSMDGPAYPGPAVEDLGPVPSQFPFKAPRRGSDAGSGPIPSDGGGVDAAAIPDLGGIDLPPGVSVPMGAGGDGSGLAAPSMAARQRRQSVIDAAIAGAGAPDPSMWGKSHQAIPEVESSDDDDDDDQLKNVHAFLDMSDED